MNLSSASAQAELNADKSHPVGTRLQGRWLVLARGIWLVLAVLALGLFIASIPTYFAFLHVICTGPLLTCRNNGLYVPSDLRSLQALGLSLNFIAIYQVALYLVFIGVYLTTGIAIFWRKSDDRMALFASLTLIIFPAAATHAILSTLPSVLWLPIQFVILLGECSIFFFFYLFPSGRFVPRWTGLLGVVVIMYWVGDSFVQSLPFNRTVSTISNMLFLGLICSIPIAQVYRYRYVSNSPQRQQTKWVVFGISIGLAGILLLETVTSFFSSLLPQGMLGDLITSTATSLFLLLFSLSIGVAILRSHLFDIDRIINRSLVYGTLTVMLALIYFGLVIGLQALVRLFTGQVPQSPLVIVASTLAIAALFQPLRRRIQRVIDRRFYRRTYDAAKTVAAFSATLRNEVDLTQLREQLLTVVQETMQSEHVSLWLCPPAHDGIQQAPWSDTPPGSSERSDAPLVRDLLRAAV